MFYRPVYFDASELFPESIVTRVGDAAFGLIDERILIALDGLRMAYGKPLWINGSGRDECGLRVLGTATGAPKSKHKPLDPSVQAFDLHTDGGEFANIGLYDWVLTNGHKHHVERVEHISATKHWVHIELSTLPTGSIKVFHP
jgi:hypothetical protein